MKPSRRLGLCFGAVMVGLCLTTLDASLLARTAGWALVLLGASGCILLIVGGIV